MTKELLEQYPDICDEIKELEQRMKNPVSDTVMGSGEEYPYTRRTVTVRGISPELRKQRDILVKDKEDIEAFISTLPTSRQRRIAALRVLHGLSWAQVAAKMGHRYSESAVKHVYYRAVGTLK